MHICSTPPKNIKKAKNVCTKTLTAREKDPTIDIKNALAKPR
jgi:hypothetical protein